MNGEFQSSVQREKANIRWNKRRIFSAVWDDREEEEFRRRRRRRRRRRINAWKRKHGPTVKNYDGTNVTLLACLFLCWLGLFTVHVCIIDYIQYIYGYTA